MADTQSLGFYQVSVECQRYGAVGGHPEITIYRGPDRVAVLSEGFATTIMCKIESFNSVNPGMADAYVQGIANILDHIKTGGKL